MTGQVSRIPGRYGSSLRVSDWGAGDVAFRALGLGVSASLTIKGLRRLIATLQRIESEYREPL